MMRTPHGKRIPKARHLAALGATCRRQLASRGNFHRLRDCLLPPFVLYYGTIVLVCQADARQWGVRRQNMTEDGGRVEKKSEKVKTRQGRAACPWRNPWRNPWQKGMKA